MLYLIAVAGEHFFCVGERQVNKDRSAIDSNALETCHVRPRPVLEEPNASPTNKTAGTSMTSIRSMMDVSPDATGNSV